MLTSVLGKSARFAELTPGECFIFANKDESYVGLKIAARIDHGRSIDCCGVLWPGHPEFDKEPGILSAEQFSGRAPVFALEGATLTPSSDPKHIHAGALNFASQPGAVIIDGAQALLVLRGGEAPDALSYIDVVTGTQTTIPTNDCVTWFTAMAHCPKIIRR